ncbi:hypothetical protein [Oceanobacter kriegii]|uniref:hypothetical protein n=1 Tax=Oceanobacter kriegii TaxID=64972 RepID=UPI0006847E60|nr:hypothetical protein [Oceanobacter kriegii]
MNRNYEIVEGIYLVQGEDELDLHNHFDFVGFDYSIAERKLELHWIRSDGDWVSRDMPQSVRITFRQVSEFRFMPREQGVPFTEDNCINSIGYWVDEDWAEGVIMAEPNQKVEPQWLTAIDFMSGAVLAVQAESADATVKA